MHLIWIFTVCKTVSGPQVNKPCQFPFTHDGRTYNKCPVDPDDSSKFWCSTKVDIRRYHVVGQQEFGHCSTRTCPLESKPASPPFTNTPSPILKPNTHSAGACSGQARCKSFVECSSKYRFSKTAKRCNLDDGGIGICCKDLIRNNGITWNIT